MGLQGSRLAGADDATQKKLMLEFLDALKGTTECNSPLGTVQQMQQIIHKHTGCSDPYLQVKDDCNQEAEKWLPRLQQELVSSVDKLNMALKIAAIGNIMDYGAYADFDVSALVGKLHLQDFTINCEGQFARALQGAKTISYFADNTGEIYFDSVLIEYLCGRESIEKLKLIIRSDPFLNDVSSEEHIPKILLQHPKIEIIGLPIVRSKQDSQIWSDITESDLILSKGMANFENYSDEPGFFFLFISKCDLVSGVVSNMMNAPVKTGDWVFMQSNKETNNVPQ
jgi:uncharacterized protein with ATP-grasp and redox domains